MSIFFKFGRRRQIINKPNETEKFQILQGRRIVARPKIKKEMLGWQGNT